MEKIRAQAEGAGRVVAEQGDYLKWDMYLITFLQAFDRAAKLRDTSLRPQGAAPVLDQALARLHAALAGRIALGRW